MRDLVLGGGAWDLRLWRSSQAPLRALRIDTPANVSAKPPKVVVAGPTRTQFRAPVRALAVDTTRNAATPLAYSYPSPMTPTLRITSFTFIALSAVAAISAGHVALGLLVLVLGSATVLPPFPPMVGALGAVLLAPVPAVLAVHSGEFSPLLLALPLMAASAISLQWRVVAWSGAFTGAMYVLCSLPVAPRTALPHVDTLVACLVPFS